MMKKFLFLIFIPLVFISGQTVVKYKTVYLDTSRVFSTAYGTNDTLHNKSRERFYRPLRLDSGLVSTTVLIDTPSGKWVRHLTPGVFGVTTRYNDYDFQVGIDSSKTFNKLTGNVITGNNYFTGINTFTDSTMFSKIKLSANANREIGLNNRSGVGNGYHLTVMAGLSSQTVTGGKGGNLILRGGGGDVDGTGGDAYLYGGSSGVPTYGNTYVGHDGSSARGNTILGTVTTGTWQGTSIETTYTNAVSGIDAGYGVTVATNGGKRQKVSADTATLSGKYWRREDTTYILASKTWSDGRFVPLSRTATAGYGLDGGGTLSSNISFAVDTTNEIATLYDVSQKLNITDSTKLASGYGIGTITWSGHTATVPVDTSVITTKGTTQLVTAPKYYTARQYFTSVAVDTIVNRTSDGTYLDSNLTVKNSITIYGSGDGDETFNLITDVGSSMSNRMFNDNGSSKFPLYLFVRARGTKASPTNTTTGDIAGAIKWFMYNSGDVEYANIVSGDHGSHSAFMVFKIKPAGGAISTDTSAFSLYYFGSHQGGWFGAKSGTWDSPTKELTFVGGSDFRWSVEIDSNLTVRQRITGTDIVVSDSVVGATGNFTSTLTAGSLTAAVNHKLYSASATPLTLYRNTNATFAVTAQYFNLTNSSSNEVSYARIGAEIYSNTATIHSGAFKIWTYRGGSETQAVVFDTLQNLWLGKDLRPPLRNSRILIEPNNTGLYYISGIGEASSTQQFWIDTLGNSFFAGKGVFEDSIRVGTSTPAILKNDGSISGTTGTFTGDLAVNGDDITSDGDLAITAAGGDVLINNSFRARADVSTYDSTSSIRAARGVVATGSTIPLAFTALSTTGAEKMFGGIGVVVGSYTNTIETGRFLRGILNRSGTPTTVWQSDSSGLFQAAGAIAPMNLTVSADGVVSTPDTVVWTAQTGSISAQNFANTATGHLYRATYYLHTTTTGTAGTVSLTLSWNDGAAKTSTSATADLTSTGNTGLVSGTQVLYVSSGVPTWATTVIGALGSPQYAVRIVLERVY